MFRLALALGKTVSELENTIGSGELTEWAAYYQIEPFGQWRDNWHAAHIATTIANVKRNRKAPPINMQDFMFEAPEIKRNRETRRVLAILDAKATKK